MHWTGANKHGPSLLELIGLHMPFSLPLLTALTSGLQKNSSGLPMQKKQQCGKCKQEGHIGMLHFMVCHHLTDMLIG